MANAWNQVGTLMGPKGDKGATGDAGPKGGSVRVASIIVPSDGEVAFSALSPSDGVQVGDLVLDANGSVYPFRRWIRAGLPPESVPPSTV